MIRILGRIISHEWRRVLMFVLIGGISFGIWTCVYYLLSRHLWITGNHTFENFISVCISAVFNFFAHRHWTFQARNKHIGQLSRYLLVLITATALQSFLFWLGHEFFHWYDFAVVIVVTGLIALYTYTLHRFFTFHDAHLVPLLSTDVGRNAML